LRLNEYNWLDIGCIKRHCSCLRHLGVLLHLAHKTYTLSLHLCFSGG
jgi:hypothetical protein